MDSRDIIGLYEAYQSVYVEQEALNEDVGYELEEAKADQGLSDKDKEKARNRRQDLSTRSRVFRHVDTRGQKAKKGYTHPAVSDNQGNQPGKYLHLKHQKKNDPEYDGPVRGGRKAGDSYYEEVDLYDVVLDHLLDEGYCDDVESAEIIMANMSEEWVDEIVEGFVSPYKTKPTYGNPKGTSPAMKALKKSDELQRTELGSPRQKAQTRRSQQMNRMFQAARNA